MVGFIDFAPTLFHLLDIETPKFMLGQAFLGPDLPPDKSGVFLYRANQEQTYIPSRAWTDGRYRLIWNFNTAYPNGARQSYQWQMPSYQAWDEAHLAGKTLGPENWFWEPMSALEFYDTDHDPYEVINLIDHPDHRERIAKMKEELLDLMIREKDLGFYPWSMRRRGESQPFYEYIRKTDQDVEQVIQAAALASTALTGDLSKLESLLHKPDPAVQYWGSRGVLRLLERKLIDEIPEAIRKIFATEQVNTELRLACAEILAKHGGDRAALNYIVDQVEANYYIAFATLQNLGTAAKPAEERLIGLLDHDKLHQFHIRSALINTGYLEYRQLFR